MANELVCNYTTGLTLYALLFNSTGQVWNGAAFEAAQAANWLTYDIAMTEVATTGVYLGTMPAAAAGAYGFAVRRQAGANPAVGDITVGNGSIPDWNGTAEVYQTGDAFARIGVAGAGLTAIPWNAAWDAEVQSEATDALNAYDPPTNAEMEARTLVAASYFDPAADTVANVTTVGAVTGAVGSVTGAVGSVTGAVGSVTGAVGSVTGNVGGNVTGSVGSVAAGGITAASIATGAIDADALAADAGAEIADAVWDEAIAGHAAVGSTGAALSAAGAAGDPWATVVPGAYGAGTAGEALGVLTDASFGNSALATLIAGLGGSGAGAITWVYTLTNAIDATAIPDAEVWVTSDAGGLTVLASGRTNASGQVTFYLDAGQIFVWRQKSGWNFTNPDTEVVV